MAANLARKGFAPAVYDRVAALAAPLIALGATQATSAGEAVRGADIILLSLPATQDVSTVLFGVGGIAPALKQGAVVVDTSTIDPIGAREFAARLAEQGVAMLNSPVSGGQKGAADGTLSCMIGGSVDALSRARPCLEAIATTIVHVGDCGAGQVAKACNQICCAANMLGVCKSIALALKLGVDPRRVREALMGGAARSSALERNAPRLIDRDFKPGFRAALMEKDIRIAAETMSRARVFAPITTSAHQVLKALVETGKADLDWGAVGALIQELSGLAPESEKASS